MQPVKTLKNQFRGIHPHLHSRWQTYGEWQSFHAAHTNDIMRLLNVRLRPAGYRAELEQSIQLWRSDKDTENPRADVVIYDTRAERPNLPGETSAPAGALVLNLAESLQIVEEPYDYTAIMITPFRDGGHAEPVAWIELLSPSNKLYAEDRRAYQHKRENLLHQGIVFIELDYLHVSPPTVQGLKRYYRKNKVSEPGSTAYRILVMNPRPTLQSGELFAHQFGVDDPVPAVILPLSSQDTIEFDFNLPYQRTFDEVFYGDNIDYTQLPVEFETYSEADRARILTRMLHVIGQAQAGENAHLEETPQPIPTLPFEEAMQRYQALP